MDKNKRVQESSCSAFATLEEHANLKLIPYIRPILIHIGAAFNLYQPKNMNILYDALGTLAESVGTELNHPHYLELLMPPLINRWNTLADQDVNIIPLFMVIIFFFFAPYLYLHMLFIYLLFYLFVFIYFYLLFLLFSVYHLSRQHWVLVLKDMLNLYIQDV